jgi:hypothetical protein
MLYLTYRKRKCNTGMKARNGGVLKQKITEIHTSEHVSPLFMPESNPHTKKNQFNHQNPKKIVNKYP